MLLVAPAVCASTTQGNCSLSANLTLTGLPEEPVVGRVGNALHANTGDGASLGIAASSHDAVDSGQTLGVSGCVVVELQPRHRAGVEDALVGRGRRRDIADLLDGRLEPDGGEIKHGNAGDVEEVVSEELDVGQALELEVGRSREGRLRIGAIRGAGKLVQRDRRLPEHVGWRAIPDRLGKARVLRPGVEGCRIVQDSEGADCGGGPSRRLARVVLDAVADGDLLKDEAGRWCSENVGW